MALNTFGTNATSTLSAMQFYKQIGTANTFAANVAQIAANIKDDISPLGAIVPGAFMQNGLLVIPNRGVLRVLRGDWVAYGSTGFPILLSAAAKTADWTSA